MALTINNWLGHLRGNPHESCAIEAEMGMIFRKPSLGFTWAMPAIPGLVNIQKAMENGPVEIVDFPIFIAWWIFPWQNVSSPGRVNHVKALFREASHPCPSLPQWRAFFPPQWDARHRAVKAGRWRTMGDGRPVQETFFAQIQWIGLKEKIQENPIEIYRNNENIYGFRLRCSLKPIHWQIAYDSISFGFRFLTSQWRGFFFLKHLVIYPLERDDNSICGGIYIYIYTHIQFITNWDLYLTQPGLCNNLWPHLAGFE